jgi:hypothetical protein
MIALARSLARTILTDTGNPAINDTPHGYYSVTFRR